MVANGLLTNPSLFAGSAITTTDCIQKWLNICYNTTLSYRNINQFPAISEKPNNLTFQCFHHHLVFMLEKILSRQEKRVFNNLQKFQDVLSFIKTKFNLEPQLFDSDNFDKTKLLTLDYTKRDEYYFKLKPKNNVVEEYDLFYDYNSEGKYFKSKVDECDWSDIFVEN